jgi:ATP-dependent protease Clp ATPase subunit
MAGIWLAGSGFVAFERKMVLKLSGPCSFCGKRAEAVFGLAGIAERDVAICDECAGLCLDIVGEETRKDYGDGVSVGSKWTAPDDFDELLKQAELDADLERRRAAVSNELQSELDRGRSSRRQFSSLFCSFCDRSQHDVAKLIAGPNAYICDVCIGDVAGILLSRRLRSG